MKRFLSLSFLLIAITANAQLFDPNSIPTSFNGVDSMGPYRWIDGPTAIQGGMLGNAVLGGTEGAITMYLCRASLADGVHPGKFFNNICNIGWGGAEVVKSTEFELLINAHSYLKPYLSQSWMNPPQAMAFIGGSLKSATASPLRVCRAAYNNGLHPGKEFDGKCNIGWGGKEVVLGSYQVLVMGFDRNAYLASKSEKTRPGQ